jgi:hypothetical protein
MLGDGFCTRPPQLDCRMESACETCAYFYTGPELLPTLWPGELISRGWSCPRCVVLLVVRAGNRRFEEDIMITGSLSVVRTLMAHDLVDEYRLLVFPLVLGSGARLFPEGAAPLELNLVSAQTAGPAVRLICARPAGSLAGGASWAG